MEKISIIIPCYNGEHTLRRCLDSVLSQSYKAFEAIIINDGSTDSTKAIAQEYVNLDTRFKLVSPGGNFGVSAARNLGLSIATGDYIQFLDADDEMLPDMLTTLHSAINKTHSDIAVCNYVGNPLFLSYFKDKVYDMSKKSDILEYYQQTFCFLLPWNKLFRRNAITVLFDEDVHFAEDELFNLAVLQNVNRIVCVDKALYIYHFAPAEKHFNAAQSKSCINKILDNTDKSSKNSIWYQGQALLPKRLKILRSLHCTNSAVPPVEDLLYTRIFDFFFWEISAFAYMKADKNLIYDEVYSVLCEDNFIKSLKVQEKYGVQFLNYDTQKLRRYSKHFVDACLWM